MSFNQSTSPLSSLEMTYPVNSGTRSGIINTTDAITGTVYYNQLISTGETAFGLYIGGGGSVILIGVDGNYNFFYDLPAGKTLYFKHIGQINSATINGNSVTSTATHMTWIGGKI